MGSGDPTVTGRVLKGLSMSLLSFALLVLVVTFFLRLAFDWHE